MSTISRSLPRTKFGRLTALSAARTKKNNPGANGNFLTQLTTDRLDNIQGNYAVAYTELATAAANLYTHTPGKTSAVDDVKMFASHFIQVFNLGVARGKYPAGHRAFYNLDVNSNAVPVMGTEEEIMQVAKDIVDGNLLRLAAGGAAMENPTAVEVGTKRNAAENLRIAQSNLKDALDAKQEALDDFLRKLIR
ncbi:MAG: hypothetical protein ACKVPJ_09245 [Chitinophagales bacterium]